MAPSDLLIRRRLKLRDLDTLTVVVQCGSMAKAAVQLGVSQPAVSNAVAELERTLKSRLLDRTPQGVEPTPYGQALLTWASAAFDDLRQGVRAIEFLSDPAAGELRIGATEPMLGGFLAAVVMRLGRRYPRVRFEIAQPVSAAQQRRELRERRLDLVIGRVSPDDGADDLLTETLFDEPWVIVAGPNNPLLRRRRLGLADLMEERWTLPPTDTVVGAHLTQAFRTAGLDRPRAAVTCASLQMHHALMLGASFLAVFPRSWLRFSPERRTVRELPVKLPGSPPPVGLMAVKGRMLSPVAEIFLSYARDLAKDPRR